MKGPASNGFEAVAVSGEKFSLTETPNRVLMDHFFKETFVMERLKLRNFGFWFSYYIYGQVCPSLRRT